MVSYLMDYPIVTVVPCSGREKPSCSLYSSSLLSTSSFILFQTCSHITSLCGVNRRTLCFSSERISTAVGIPFCGQPPVVHSTITQSRHIVISLFYHSKLTSSA